MRRSSPAAILTTLLGTAAHAAEFEPTWESVGGERSLPNAASTSTLSRI
jgi:hypothetical protein